MNSLLKPIQVTDKKTFLIIAIFAAGELILGYMAGYYFLYNYNLTSPELSTSVLMTYIPLNGIFFTTTILPGIMSIVLLKIRHRLLLAILLSFGLGSLFLIFYALTFNLLQDILSLRFILMFFPLLGFVAGFNAAVFLRTTIEKQ